MTRPPLPDNARDEKAQDATSEKDVRDSNTSQRLDERLDHGIKESFPGSDPVSVKVSKYAPGDPRGAEPSANMSEDGMLTGALEEARKTGAAISEKVRTTAKNLSDNGRRLAPQLGRGRRVVEETLRENPVPALVIAGLIGCGIAVVTYEILSKRKPAKLRRRAYGADEIS
jgi:hypothetical protein